MSKDQTPCEHRFSAVSALSEFEAAVTRYSALRSELAGVGAIVGLQFGPATEAQRNTLQRLGADHHMAGEQVKAIAMTLMSHGWLDRCIDLVRKHGEDLH